MRETIWRGNERECHRKWRRHERTEDLRQSRGGHLKVDHEGRVGHNVIVCFACVLHVFCMCVCVCMCMCMCVHLRFRELYTDCGRGTVDDVAQEELVLGRHNTDVQLLLVQLLVVPTGRSRWRAHKGFASVVAGCAASTERV